VLIGDERKARVMMGALKLPILIAKATFVWAGLCRRTRPEQSESRCKVTAIMAAPATVS
jgi:hypothetical protein